MTDKRLSKMYLFNEDTFRKMQERLAEEKHHNVLDKAMKDVLRKKMSSNDKWLMYRHELYKFLNMRRRLNRLKHQNQEKDVIFLHHRFVRLKIIIWQRLLRTFPPS